jgi:hypothetical protein
MHLTTVLSALALGALASSSNAAWIGAHGESDNSGFANVNTRPARWSAWRVAYPCEGANPIYCILPHNYNKSSSWNFVITDVILGDSL